MKRLSDIITTDFDNKPKLKLVKITIAEVKRKIKANGKWDGMIVANNVSPYHVVGGWALGCRIEVSNETQLADAIQNYKLYNYDRELWRNYNANPHFYQVKQETTK